MLPNANTINSIRTRKYNKGRCIVVDNERRIKDRKEEKKSRKVKAKK
jgi:hypothetical protein